MARSSSLDSRWLESVRTLAARIRWPRVSSPSSSLQVSPPSRPKAKPDALLLNIERTAQQEGFESAESRKRTLGKHVVEALSSRRESGR